MTPQGMRIQIADAEKRSMFPSGSAEMYDYTGELLGQIMVAIESLPNDSALIGHTDATPYRSDNGYSNWELSTDRANSSRRALIDAGLSESRIVRVVGMAAQEPLNVEDPFSAENRRISVLILRENHKPADAITIQLSRIPGKFYRANHCERHCRPPD
jgi:chemotaxis protein MotB